ncbi:MAG: glycosyltransferase family 4 protein [Saprospiraceae bacterium]|nr:glycosyltransferase family 4 protein [Saprospiraceae bacterium]
MIWVVTYNFGAVKAGPVIRFMRYASYFNKARLKVSFITIEKNKPKDEESPFYDVQGIRANSPAELNNKVLLKLSSTNLKPKAIIFLSLDFYSLFHLLYSRKHKVPLIYVSTMQFDIKNKAYGVKRNIFMRYILKYFYRLTFKQLDYIVSSSDELLEDFLKLKVPKSKLKTIYNGVDVEKFRPVNYNEKTKYRNQLGLPENSTIITFIGLYVERKGVDYLAMLWEKFTERYPQENLHLLLVGENALDVPENSHKFKKEWPIAKNKLEARQDVSFLPFQRNIEFVHYCSDFFIFPSRLEGMPNVLLEAMSSGLPILVNKFKGFSSAYGINGVHYLLLEENLEKDIQVLKSIIENKLLSSTLSVNVRKYTIDHFAIEKSIQDYLYLMK